MPLSSFLAGSLAFVGAVLALTALGIMHLTARRTLRQHHAETDELRDEIWELREAAAARDRAEAANEAKSRFLASVTHEVRTPLNGILGMADLLSATQLDAEQLTYIAAIRSSGSALASLIEEILDFAKIEAGKVELAEEPFDLTALVEGVTELLAPRAQGKSLEIASTIASDVPGRVVGDAVRLRQILLNLAGNAIKFTETGGLGITVTRGDAETDRIVFEVVDTGPGVPVERRAAIFEEFEQAGEPVHAGHGGTGLGLAISKRLAERMGGTLRLTDRDGESGARFVVDLPLPRDPGIAEANQDIADLGGQRALVIAASPFEAGFLATRLAEAGAEVVQAGATDDGLQRLQSDGRFDLVLVDCAFGEEATHRLGAAARAAAAGRTIVLFSPYERRVFGQSSARDFDGWLVKPIRRRSLFTVLGETRRAAERPQPLASSTAPVFGPKILLAEDNEINALIATRHLQRLGADVTHAPDGLAALDLVEAALGAGQPFDAMVLDIRMPGLDGIELARRVRLAEVAHGARAARLVALSADIVDAERRSASLAGIDEYIGKPVSYERLASSLRTAEIATAS